MCGSPDLEPVLTLPATPPANALVRTPVPQEVFPQELRRCRTCAHVQLGHLVDPDLLFSDYVYVSSTSPSFVRHFEAYARDTVAACALKAGDLVVEVGSNDGVLLRPFQAAGMKVLGVDPAKQIAEAATASGVETWCEFFDEAVAKRILAERGPAAVVCANNCMAHIADLDAVVRGVKLLLRPGGVFIMEVQYVADLVREGLWDMVYAEHLDYHAVGPLIPYFRRHGLGVFDVQRVPTHGGSIRVFVRAEPPFADRAEWDAREAAWTSADAFRKLGERIATVGPALKAALAGAVKGGGEVAGYGVPAKTTTLMYTLGLTRSEIAFLVDDSAWKIGLLSPGLHLPILAPTALTDRKPAAIVVFAWNFAEPIVSRVAKLYAEQGLEPPPCVVPLPQPRVLAPVRA